MKTRMQNLFIALSVLALPALVQAQFTFTTNNGASAIPWNEIGAKAGADYKGDGLAVLDRAVGGEHELGSMNCERGWSVALPPPLEWVAGPITQRVPIGTLGWWGCAAMTYEAALQN